MRPGFSSSDTGTMRYGGGYIPTPIRGVKPGRSSWNVGAGLKYENTRFDVEVNYQYTSRSKLDNHQVSGMVGIKGTSKNELF